LISEHLNAFFKPHQEILVTFCQVFSESNV